MDFGEKKLRTITGLVITTHLIPEGVGNNVINTNHRRDTSIKLDSLRQKVREFFVEAKWRQHLYNGKLIWSNPKQYERYKSYAVQHPVYVVIGLGGIPSNPFRIFFGEIYEMSSFEIEEKQLDSLDYLVQKKKYQFA